MVMKLVYSCGNISTKASSKFTWML